MSWTYSGTPSAGLDAVRFWIQDTQPDRPLLSNEEITYLIALADPLWASDIATAALACDVLTTKFATEVSISADGVSISLEQLQDKYAQLGKSLRETWNRVAGAGAMPLAFGIDTFQMPDFGVTPPSFGRGFTDNPRAGGQNYGWSEDGYWGGVGEIPESGYWTGP